MSSHRVPNWTEGRCQSEVCQGISHALQFDVLFFWTVNTCQIISSRGLVHFNCVASSVLVTCPSGALWLHSLAGLELITCTKYLTFWCITILLPVHLMCPGPRERDAVWEEFVYLILFLQCVANRPCLLKKNDEKKSSSASVSRSPCLLELYFLLSFQSVTLGV